MSKPLASVSLDLDNKWSYLKTHGDCGWESFPSYLDIVVPRVLHFLSERQLKITFFVVGQDAALPRNQQVLKSVAAAGHEIGNHSFHHEPWLHLYSSDAIAAEIGQAEAAIIAATGEIPRGFRGPGFSLSSQVLEELVRRGYQYDCSTFPTFLGPLARMYYFFTAKLSREQRLERKQLFGKARDGFMPLKPYVWNTPAGAITEIPVTTVPLFKTPIHVSYLLYIAKYSRYLAIAYWRLSLGLCRLFRVEPSLLLHPLDFLGCEDDQDLSFFPVMDKSSAWKLQVVADIIDILQGSFHIVTMQEHDDRFRRDSASEDPFDAVGGR
jgi:peptidoglycan-N-acetylglucosamine deacetylase